MENLADKKYTKAEVLELLRKQQFEYEMSLADQKQRIFELLEETESLQKEIDTYKAKDETISQALCIAVTKAKEIEELAKKKYQANLSKLVIFQNKFARFYQAAVKKYPLDDTLIGIDEFLKRMDEILGIDSMKPRKKTPSLFGSGNLALDILPNESGFDFSEALNPSRELEDICRELGLID